MVYVVRYKLRSSTCQRCPVIPRSAIISPEWVTVSPVPAVPFGLHHVPAAVVWRCWDASVGSATRPRTTPNRRAASVRPSLPVSGRLSSTRLPFKHHSHAHPSRWEAETSGHAQQEKLRPASSCAMLKTRRHRPVTCRPVLVAHAVRRQSQQVGSRRHSRLPGRAVTGRTCTVTAGQHPRAESIAPLRCRMPPHRKSAQF